jgi:CheY-like chemotaxis protein
LRFLEAADLVIHDAQYTLDQFPERIGWGHSPAERAVDYAITAGVRRLALCHHDPENDDDTLDAIVARCNDRASKGSHIPEVFGAAEGHWVELGTESASFRPAARRSSALLSSEPRDAAKVLIVDDDPDMLELLCAALDEENVRLFSARDGEEALRIARAERPTLMVLDLHLPRLDGLAVCRELRSDQDPRLRDLPILVLTGTRLDEGNVVEAFSAGATDFLSKPIKPTLLRSRVRGWLLRE